MLASLALALSALAGSPADPWAGCLPGTWVRFRLAREPEGDGGPAGQRITVIEAGPGGALLRVDSLGPSGELLFQEETRHRFGPRPERKEAGTGTVVVEGREYDCTIRESRSGETRTRVWLHPEQGDLPLRIEETGPDRTATTRLVRPREVREAAGREFACRVLERVEGGKDRAPVTIRTWECPDVPGLVVREEVRTDARGRPRLLIRDLVDLEVRKVSRGSGGR